MKKTLLVITLFILGLSSITEAQIIVNSTQASTIRIIEKSSRQKGLILRPEIGIGTLLDSPGGYYSNFIGNIGYQFNPYITLGGGLGIHFMENSSAIPLYFDVKGYFSNRVWSPYYNIKLGYSLNLSNSTPEHQPHDNYCDYTLGGGIYYAFGFGMNYKNFDFGIEISAMGGESVDHICYYYYDYYNGGYNYYNSYDKEVLSSLKLTFGYNFPLNTKKK
ncbi:MAG: hypothetical protein H6Q16_927 [Bacteroidetes bacterium]|nr:hypothetical protein [Bacteroidota bacterium]